MKKDTLTIDEYLDGNRVEFLLTTVDHDKFKETIDSIYNSLNVSVDTNLIMTGIARSTFTKRGEYHLHLVGNKTTNEVLIIISGDQLRGGKSIYIKLPGIFYIGKWFGLLGWKIVPSK